MLHSCLTSLRLLPGLPGRAYRATSRLPRMLVALIVVLGVDAAADSVKVGHPHRDRATLVETVHQHAAMAEDSEGSSHCEHCCHAHGVSLMSCAQQIYSSLPQRFNGRLCLAGIGQAEAPPTPPPMS